MINPKAGEIFYVNKPLHWTSFDVVKRIRGTLLRRVKEKKMKVGHAGTLDPLATGVMFICTGKATKRIEELQYQTKEYVADIKLGATTPSFDLETEIDATYPVDHIAEEQISEALKSFIGTINQIPPSYSACKIDGRRAYDFMRKGEEVELKPKQLVIDEIEMLNYDANTNILSIRVVCSKGTYIRALARDIAIALGSGGHLVALTRTRVGDITLDKCQDVNELITYLDTVEIAPDEPQQ